MADVGSPRSCPTALPRPAVSDVFDLVRQGVLVPDIGGRYPLKDAAQAHRDIESRTTSGKLLLYP